jgi:hypothetical protein
MFISLGCSCHGQMIVKNKIKGENSLIKNNITFFLPQNHCIHSM